MSVNHFILPCFDALIQTLCLSESCGGITKGTNEENQTWLNNFLFIFFSQIPFKASQGLLHHKQVII